MTKFSIIKCKESSNSLCTIYDENGKIFFTATSVFISDEHPNKCTSHWTIVRNIGEPSSNALVYLVRCDGNKEDKNKLYVLKITNKYLPNNEQLMEFKNQDFFGEIGVSIPIYQALFDRNGDVSRMAIIMEPLQITVKSYILEYLKHTPIENWDYSKIKNILLKCLSIVDDLFSFGYIHGDHHLSNFMFERAGDIDTIKLIDFGKVSYMKDKKEYKKHLDEFALGVLFVQMLMILTQVRDYYGVDLPDKAKEFIRILNPPLFDKAFKRYVEEDFPIFEKRAYGNVRSLTKEELEELHRDFEEYYQFGKKKRRTKHTRRTKTK